MGVRRVRRGVPFTMLVVITACSAATASTEASCDPSPFRRSPPLVIAHAGGNEMSPSNTMYALRQAMQVGADVLDLDLRMTRDGVIVARHDRELSTTTNGSGPVDARTWSEVAGLDAAALWTGPPLTDDVRVARLDEALAEFPDVLFSLEIKQVEPPISDALCDTIERAGATERVFISSNDDVATYGFQAACPDVTITTTFRDLDARAAARDAGEPWCSASPIGQPPYRADGFDGRVAEAHTHGAAVFTWTVNDPDALRELARIGVDGVYTDRPDLARQIFDEFAG